MHIICFKDSPQGSERQDRTEMEHIVLRQASSSGCLRLVLYKRTYVASVFYVV